MKIKLLTAYILCFSTLAHGHGYYGVATSQNKRPYQEDRFTAITGFGGGMGDFFGIYDGHGGSNTSSFLQLHFPERFHSMLAMGDLDEMISKDRATHIIDQCQLLKKVFLLLEGHVCINYTDGSTALVAYIDAYNRLNCAWAGDTRLVLEKNGTVGFATTDHKPDEPSELKRITAAGGIVEKWGVYRVGGLAVSRSIGDSNIKKNYPGQVIAVPDCKRIELSPENHFLIMASDGLWDVMSSEEAVKIVQAQLKKRLNFSMVYRYTDQSKRFMQHEDIDYAARCLQDIAIERGSEDNITICIIYFDWPAQPSAMRWFWNWLGSVFYRDQVYRVPSNVFE